MAEQCDLGRVIGSPGVTSVGSVGLRRTDATLVRTQASLAARARSGGAG